MLNNSLPLPKRRGFMLVLSSPSGTGKTTLARRILESEQEIDLSISVTTRPKRPSEIEGKDYIFVDDSTFQHMREQQHFLEHALVHGHRYGTPKASIDAHLEAGRDVLFDIDWQGTQQLKKVALHDLVSIFLLPPSLEILAKRLRKRREDSENTIENRLAQAENEISHWDEYDYTLINDELAHTSEAIHHILHAERLKRYRQVSLRNFIGELRHQ